MRNIEMYSVCLITVHAHAASPDAMQNDSTVATQSRTQTHAHSDAVICCSIAIDMPMQSGRNAKRPDCCNTITHTPIPMQSYAAALLSTCPVRAQCKTTRLLQHNHARTHTPCSASACSHLLQQALAFGNNQKYIIIIRVGYDTLQK